MQIGNIVCPKSVNPNRIRENIDVFDFELTPDDVSVIEALDAGHRIGPEPDTFGSRRTGAGRGSRRWFGE